MIGDLPVSQHHKDDRLTLRGLVGVATRPMPLDEPAPLVHHLRGDLASEEEAAADMARDPDRMQNGHRWTMPRLLLEVVVDSVESAFENGLLEPIPR